MKVVDVIETLTKILKDRDFLPKVQIIHSDRESLFKNEAYYEFLNQHNKGYLVPAGHLQKHMKIK